ncbi:hypothetical protein ACOME3_000981 [Neoechinorhynchus agilis]
MSREMKMYDKKSIETKYLHDYPEYRESVIELLKNQWPKENHRLTVCLTKDSLSWPQGLVVVDLHKNDVRAYCQADLDTIEYAGCSSRSAFVEYLCVRPGFREKGLGTSLLLQMESLFVNEMVECVFLITDEAELFYTKLGYQRCNQDPVFKSNEALSRRVNAALLLDSESTIKMRTFMYKKL